MRKTIKLLLILLLSFTLVACSSLDFILDDLGLDNEDVNNQEEINNVENSINEDGYYTSEKDVALYINTYDKLPDNFITKREAAELGWESNKGNL